jgi:hypothetical protein
MNPGARALTGGGAPDAPSPSLGCCPLEPLEPLPPPAGGVFPSVPTAVSSSPAAPSRSGPRDCPPQAAASAIAKPKPKADLVTRMLQHKATLVPLESRANPGGFVAVEQSETPTRMAAGTVWHRATCA